MTPPLSVHQLAERVARDIPAGAYVNLGIGQPTAVANYLQPEQNVTLHTENGMLGMGPEAAEEEIDDDLLNAGKFPVTELAGASYFDHAESFAMIRGRHLDICVLGAFQVSAHGDLANWKTSEDDAIPGVGGAMDLAVGAKAIYVMMRLLTPQGASKLVQQCSYPLTGVACVSRVYTDLGTFAITDEGVMVSEPVGYTFRELEDIVGFTLAPAEDAGVRHVASRFS